MLCSNGATAEEGGVDGALPGFPGGTVREQDPKLLLCGCLCAFPCSPENW